MTRTKSKPPLRKPLFDEGDVLRFAAAGDAGQSAETATEAGGRERKAGKKVDATGSALTLMLSPETVARLRAVAERKGKTIDQVVEKLVTKHLDRH